MNDENVAIGDGTTNIKGFFCQYRWLSNFWPCKVEYDGHKFKSVEQAYQYAKAVTDEDKK